MMPNETGGLGHFAASKQCRGSGSGWDSYEKIALRIYIIIIIIIIIINIYIYNVIKFPCMRLSHYNLLASYFQHFIRHHFSMVKYILGSCTCSVPVS